MPDQRADSAPSIAEAKAAWKVEKDAKKAERRAVRRWRRRCFWTRPIGHAWKYDHIPYTKVCTICDKEVYVG